MPNFDFLNDSGSPQRPPAPTVPQPNRRVAGATLPRAHMPATHHRAPRDDEKALLLLAGVLAFCGYLYLLGIALSAIGALLVLAAQPGSAVMGVVMGIVGIVACAIQSLFCFAASGFIKLAVRGVHAVEETASHLRAMHR